MPALHVAIALAGLMAAVAALLFLLLCQRARTGGGSWRAGAGTLAGRSRRTLPWLMAAVLPMAAAELLLPAERISTQVHHLEGREEGEVELSYPVCCTGGGMASCVLQDAAGLQAGQAVELRRTRLLGRCHARAIDGPPAPCRCS